MLNSLARVGRLSSCQITCGSQRLPWLLRGFAVQPAFLAALTTFREIKGHARVPLGFVVPSEHPWPVGTHGVRLGSHVNRARQRAKKGMLPPSDKAVLDSRGFCWDVSQWQWERILNALEVFRSVHGHLLVPRSFVVPSMPPWPRDAWDMKLGHRVNSIRSGGHHVGRHPARHAQLDALGFIWRDRDRRWHEVYVALAAYKEAHGHLRVPRAFIVPAYIPWPAEAWGMALGKRVSYIRARAAYVKGNPTRRKQLDELGFCWDEFERRWEVLLSALVVYKELHGDLLVPKAFVVPSEAPWPIDAWGAKLGDSVHNIRLKGDYIRHDPKRRQELDAKGFVWRVNLPMTPPVAIPSRLRDLDSVDMDPHADTDWWWRKGDDAGGEWDKGLTH